VRHVDHPLGRRPTRRWAFASWWFSLVFVLPLLAVLATVLYVQFGVGRSQVSGEVRDAFTDEAVPGATVRIGENRTQTNGDGRFSLRRGEDTGIAVEKEGYDGYFADLDDDADAVSVRLRPNTLSGTVVHRATEQPLGGVIVELVADERVLDSATTDDDGVYRFTDLPDEVTHVVFRLSDYATVQEEIGPRVDINVSMRPAVIAGTVTDASGQPIPLATVAIGDVWTETGDDGTYRIAEGPESGDLIFKAPGYHALVLEFDEDANLDVTLEEKPIRGIYMTAGSAGDRERFTELLDLVDRTELNAVVVDIKDSNGWVFYDTEVEFAHEIDAVRPAYDVREVLAEMQTRGIYTIARIVIFEDPILAEARPEWAIIDNTDGSVWRTWNGLPWVNPYREEVWNYNIELMLEAVELGFDEIQLDYMRFPSDGPLNRAEYGVPEHDGDTRSAAIQSFLRATREALIGTPAYLAGDIFGLTLWELGEGTIGQYLETVTAELDYICPMIYPSHFYTGSMGFDIPNNHPYEVILWSLNRGGERMPQYKNKIRPWLQDFSYGQGITYGDAEVRAQIDASDEFGATGWLLWNAANRYHEGALRPNS
jgi:hypothetical protein